MRKIRYYLSLKSLGRNDVNTVLYDKQCREGYKPHSKPDNLESYKTFDD